MTAISRRSAPTPIQAVVFDFDGTIIDTETPVFESWRETYEAYGVEPLSRSDWRDHIGTTSQPFHPLDELERRLVEAGKPVDRERMANERMEIRNAMLDRVPLRAGIAEWLAAAEQSNVAVAVASSSPITWVQQQLERVRLQDRFPIVSCAGDGVPGKPDPAVYEIACAHLGVQTDTAVAIEDSPVGSQAAAAAGLYVVVAPGPMTTGLRFPHADIEVSALADLPAQEWLDSR